MNRWADNGKSSNALGRIVLPLFILLSVAAFYIIGQIFDLQGDRIADFVGWAADNPMALLIVIAAYVLFGLFGTPQFLLHTMTGAVLPPVQALTYAWVATMVSATLHFFVGRQFRDWIGAASGKRLTRLRAMISQNGIVSSAVIRNVPAGPFIFVNIVCGASGMRGYQFLAGTGIGIIPKAVASILLGVNLGAFVAEPSATGFVILGLILAAVVFFSLQLTKVMQRFAPDA